MKEPVMFFFIIFSPGSCHGHQIKKKREWINYGKLSFFFGGIKENPFSNIDIIFQIYIYYY